MTQAQKETYSKQIKEKARELGFFSCGIAQAGLLADDARRLEEWLKNNQHGEMQYMENYFDKRVDPRKLVPGAQSVISVLMNYYPKEQQPQDTAQIAKYAYGEDYHFVMKRRLRQLAEFLQETIGAVEGRAFVDTAPVLDRAWAYQAGLGWIGKNTQLITRQQGSFFVIGELIIDTPLAYDTPIRDYCGKCTRCIDACPTQAITQPFVVDSNRCISYLTIEYRNELPTHLQKHFNEEIFGCDICQDVCPWNARSIPHAIAELEPHEELLRMRRNDWLDITEEVYRRVFKKSAVKRAKFKGLTRNIRYIYGSQTQSHD